MLNIHLFLVLLPFLVTADQCSGQVIDPFQPYLNKNCPCSQYDIENPDGSCLPCSVDNCLLCKYDDPQLCDFCKNGYTLIEKQCLKCSEPLCQRCEVNNPNKCRKCINNLQLQDGKCLLPECDPHLFYNGKQCVCKRGEYKSQAQCKKCRANCIECDSSDKCKLCNQGYYLNNKYECLKCNPNCLRCIGRYSCLETRSGYYVDQQLNTIQPLPQQIKAITYIQKQGQLIKAMCSPGCLTCSNFQTCDTCIIGRYLKQGKCQICHTRCRTCSQNENKICTSCYSGYGVMFNDCVKCNEGCNDCFHPQICIQCLKGYYLSEQKCQKCIENCERCQNNKQCLQCVPGYTVIENLCAECLAGCKYCNSNDITQCDVCLEGYYLNGDQCKPCRNCQQCDQLGDCISCIRGYTLNPNKKCSPVCQFPCSRCHESTGNCEGCFMGYQLSNQTCIENLSCKNPSQCLCPIEYNFYQLLTQFSCLQCYSDPNCQICSQIKLDECEICKPGYYLMQYPDKVKRKWCQPCPNNCQICQSQFYCTKCKSGYYMQYDIEQKSTGICSQCSSLCQTCDKSASLCKTCQSNHTLIGHKCRAGQIMNIKFVFTDLLEDFMNKIINFKFDFLEIVGSKYKGQSHLITITSIKPGSTIVESELQIIEGTNQSEIRSTLKQKLKSGSSLGGAQLTQQIQIQGFSNEQQQQSKQQQQQLNILALILGVSIPCGIIIILIILYFIMKKCEQDPASQISVENYLQ